MSSKEAIIDMIQKLLEDTSVEDVMAELYVWLAIDEGLKELDAGQGISHEDAKPRMAKWLN